MQNDQQPSPTDIGAAATSPPAWCAPDTEPDWYRLTEQAGDVMVCAWTRTVPAGDPGADVWIAAEDRIVDGRVIRSAPRIHLFEPPTAGIDSARARQIARALITAADVITDSWLDDEGNV